MSHPDHDALLRLVAGDADAETRRHTETCAECTADLAAMSRARSAAQALAAEPALGTLTRPPSGVWEAIERELDEPPAAVTPLSARSAPVAAPAPAPAPRRRTWLVVAASVAAGVILGGTAVAVSNHDSDDSGQAGARTSALKPFDGHPTTGTLELSGGPSDQQLSVTVRDADPADGFLEVWLLDASTGGMVSLGVLDGDHGSYAVPAGIDLSAYDQVDLSREPFDGDPAHSTVSLARGPVP